MGTDSLYVITISRQIGSGGSDIGQHLSRNLGIFYADRDIISAAAKKFSVFEKDLESLEEKTLFWKTLMQTCLTSSDKHQSSQVISPTDTELFKTESEIIKHIAEERSAVIIGRCGSYIFRKHPYHISLFVHADIAFRKERIQNSYNLSEESALKMIAQSDRERSHYNHKNTGEDWADAKRYNLSIDTSKIGLDKSVELIMKYLEYRFSKFKIQ